MKIMIMNITEDLDLCRELVGEMTPEYLDSYDKVIYGKKLCHYNMFIAKKRNNRWLL